MFEDDAPLFAAAPTKRALTVGELTAHIKGVLEEGFGKVTVQGEISAPKRAASGHVYFTLKDPQADAIINAVVWARSAERLKFELQSGQAVLVRGNVDVYAPRGSYSLICQQIEPVGQGALELAFGQLKEKLQKLGWFDSARKRPLPAFPARIGVVTSPTGAALRDVLKILAKRWPTAEVLFAPALVQGQGAAASVAAAIRLLNRTLPPPDVLVVGRGGGSLEDLWAFNEEAVAQAIFESQAPVISAVGHETDFTIADFVADVRAATPSEAAEMVVPDQLEFLRRLQSQEQRLKQLLRRRVEAARQRLESLARRRCFSHPKAWIEALRQDVDRMQERAARAMLTRRERLGAKLSHHAARLDALSPLKALARGYSLTETLDGQRIRSLAAVRVGAQVRVRLADGQFLSTVERLEP